MILKLPLHTLMPLNVTEMFSVIKMSLNVIRMSENFIKMTLNFACCEIQYNKDEI